MLSIRHAADFLDNRANRSKNRSFPSNGSVSLDQQVNKNNTPTSSVLQLLKAPPVPSFRYDMIHPQPDPWRFTLRLAPVNSGPTGMRGNPDPLDYRMFCPGDCYTGYQSQFTPAVNVSENTQTQRTFRRHKKSPRLKKGIVIASGHFRHQEQKQCRICIDVKAKSRHQRYIFGPTNEQAAKDRLPKMAKDRVAMDEIVFNPLRSYGVLRQVAHATDMPAFTVMLHILNGPQSDKLRRNVIFQMYAKQTLMNESLKFRPTPDFECKAKQYDKPRQLLPDVTIKEWRAKPMEIPLIKDSMTDVKFTQIITPPPNCVKKNRPPLITAQWKSPCDKPFDETIFGQANSTIVPADEDGFEKHLSGDCIINTMRKVVGKRPDHLQTADVRSSTNAVDSTKQRIIVKHHDFGEHSAEERNREVKPTVKPLKFASGRMADSVQRNALETDDAFQKKQDAQKKASLKLQNKLIKGEKR